MSSSEHVRTGWRTGEDVLELIRFVDPDLGIPVIVIDNTPEAREKLVEALIAAEVEHLDDDPSPRWYREAREFYRHKLESLFGPPVELEP